MMKARECVSSKRKSFLDTDPFPFLEACRYSGHGANSCFSSKGPSKSLLLLGVRPNTDLALCRAATMLDTPFYTMVNPITL